MSRELWAVERLTEKRRVALRAEGKRIIGNLTADWPDARPGDILESLLDFDAIWDRYYDVVGDLNQNPGRLTYDELKQVVLGGTDNE